MSETRTRPVDPPSAIRLRSATHDDVGAVADIWYVGWREGHLGHVPEELVGHRTLPDLARLAGERVSATTVAVAHDRVVGFVVVHDDELEQLYVASDVRGTGVARALIAHAETVIAARFETAWLAVVAGNTTARAFYGRRGWRDDGSFDKPTPTADEPMRVRAHRYTKRLTKRLREEDA